MSGFRQARIAALKDAGSAILELREQARGHRHDQSLRRGYTRSLQAINKLIEQERGEPLDLEEGYGANEIDRSLQA